MDECLAFADLGASINLMPLSVWKMLSLLEISPTCMTLELADRSISHPVGVSEDVFIKTGRALIDVYKGELTLRVGNKAVTFDLDQTSTYSANYDAEHDNESILEANVEIQILEDLEKFLHLVISLIVELLFMKSSWIWNLRFWVRLWSTTGIFNWLNNRRNNGVKIWYLSFNLDSQRLDIFGGSVISKRYRVLCYLGFTFHYCRRRRGSRNHGSLKCNSTSSGDTLQIFLWVSNGVTGESS
nr:reverse transcriptase domain-containing protein [Tanacetum cinerariifolium]